MRHFSLSWLLALMVFFGGCAERDDSGTVSSLATMQGQTPLHNAAWCGDVDEAKRLLRAGADVNAVNDEGNTPLIYATVIPDNGPMIELLLSHGADPNIVNGENLTALMTTLGYNKFDTLNESVIPSMLKAKAGVNVRDEIGRGPLNLACENASPDTVSLLIDAGADVNQPAEDGWTPLHYAACREDPEFVPLLLKGGARVDSKDNTGRDPLSFACEYAPGETVSLLAKKGVGVNLADEDGWTPLHYAAARGEVDIVTRLLDAGAKLDARTKKDESVLFTAVDWSSPDVVEQLKDHRTLEPSWNDLHWAAITGEPDDVKKALDAGSDINARDAYGRTALLWATLYTNFDVVKFLLETDADPSLADNDGYCPLFVPASASIELMKLFKDNGADLNATDNEGWTALFHAANYGEKRHVAWLVEQGLDMNHRDKQGRTVLHHLAEEGDSWKIEFLLEKGANWFIRDNEGNVPSDLAGEDTLQFIDFKPGTFNELEATTERVLAARANNSLKKYDPADATSPREAIRRMVRALERGDRDEFLASLIVNDSTTPALSATIDLTEASLKLRQSVIDEFGKEGWTTFQTNDKHASVTYFLLDESIVDDVFVKEVDADTAECTVPSLATAGPLRVRRIDGLWKVDSVSLFAPGTKLGSTAKLFRDDIAAIKKATKELHEKEMPDSGMTVEEFDERTCELFTEGL